MTDARNDDDNALVERSRRLSAGIWGMSTYKGEGHAVRNRAGMFTDAFTFALMPLGAVALWAQDWLEPSIRAALIGVVAVGATGILARRLRAFRIHRHGSRLRWTIPRSLWRTAEVEATSVIDVEVRAMDERPFADQPLAAQVVMHTAVSTHALPALLTPPEAAQLAEHVKELVAEAKLASAGVGGYRGVRVASAQAKEVRLEDVVAADAKSAKSKRVD